MNTSNNYTDDSSETQAGPIDMLARWDTESTTPDTPKNGGSVADIPQPSDFTPPASLQELAKRYSNHRKDKEILDTVRDHLKYNNESSSTNYINDVAVPFSLLLDVLINSGWLGGTSFTISFDGQETGAVVVIEKSLERSVRGDLDEDFLYDDSDGDAESEYFGCRDKE